MPALPEPPASTLWARKLPVPSSSRGGLGAGSPGRLEQAGDGGDEVAHVAEIDREDDGVVHLRQVGELLDAPSSQLRTLATAALVPQVPREGSVGWGIPGYSGHLGAFSILTPSPVQQTSGHCG